MVIGSAPKIGYKVRWRHQRTDRKTGHGGGGEREGTRDTNVCVCVLHKRAGGQSPGCWSSTLRHCLVAQATAAADVDMKVTITVLFVSCVPNLIQHKLCTVSLSLYLYFFLHPSICCACVFAGCVYVGAQCVYLSSCVGV